MKLWGVYQVYDGGSTGATDPDTYRLIGIFWDKSRAEEKGPDLVRAHDWYHAETHSIYIPDHLVVLFLDAAEDAIDL